MKTKDKVANAIKWIDGLLVTTVKQGECELGNKETGFCCLGYGCYVLNINCPASQAYSASFARKVGLEHRAALFSPPERIGGLGYNSLVELNDSSGMNFSQIAKFMISRDFSMFEDDVAAGLVEHYKKEQLAVNH